MSEGNSEKNPDNLKKWDFLRNNKIPVDLGGIQVNF